MFDFFKTKDNADMTIETTKFARKPFFVDGVQVTDDNIEEVAVWCQGEILPDGDNHYIKVRVARPMNERQTRAYPGDWVLYAGTGFKVYTNKAFHKSFEKVDQEEMVFTQDKEEPIGTLQELRSVKPLPE